MVDDAEILKAEALGGDKAGFIRAHTVVGAAWLCPEIPLHLVTEECALWRAGEAELAALGLQDPYWAFAWAGGQVLARYLLDHPDEVRDRKVLSFGAGGGLEAIAAMRSGAAEVLALEIDPLAIEAIRLNAALSQVPVQPLLLDVLAEDRLGPIDLILAGDVLYDGALARRANAWLRRRAEAGAGVFIGDPGRGHVPPGAAVLASYEAPADVDTRGEILRTAKVYRLL
jgi:predicted nicotinamide N-methyase